MHTPPPPADGTEPTPPPTPTWWEDPELATAVAEVEDFISSAGWDQPAQLFALVRTADLIGAEPGLAASLDGSGALTAIAQESLPGGPDADLSESLAQVSWPGEVAGCVLVQEIVVLPPAAAPAAGQEITAEEAAAHPDRAEARLVAGVLRGQPGGACLLRVRDSGAEPLRGGDLAPNLLTALQATFTD